jgi:hypothetical protein
MDHMTRRAFGAAGFGLLLATSTTFAQQQSPTVRVRGTVEKPVVSNCIRPRVLFDHLVGGGE